MGKQARGCVSTQATCASWVPSAGLSTVRRGEERKGGLSWELSGASGDTLQLPGHSKDSDPSEVTLEPNLLVKLGSGEEKSVSLKGRCSWRVS